MSNLFDDLVGRHKSLDIDFPALRESDSVVPLLVSPLPAADGCTERESVPERNEQGQP